jgi:hypothetical protein
MAFPAGARVFELVVVEREEGDRGKELWVRRFPRAARDEGGSGVRTRASVQTSGRPGSSISLIPILLFRFLASLNMHLFPMKMNLVQLHRTRTPER